MARQSGYPAGKIRQGAIALGKRWQRVVFVAGLAGALILLLAPHLLGSHR